MYKHIIIPTDGSVTAMIAVKKGLEFARSINAKVTALSVHEPYHVFALKYDVLAESEDAHNKSVRAKAQKNLDAVIVKAKKMKVVCSPMIVASDEPYEAIIETAKKEKCDLIAMSSHGRTGLTALVVESQTQKILTHSTIPVLVYR